MDGWLSVTSGDREVESRHLDGPVYHHLSQLSSTISVCGAPETRTAPKQVAQETMNANVDIQPGVDESTECWITIGIDGEGEPKDQTILPPEDVTRRKAQRLD